MNIYIVQTVELNKKQNNLAFTYEDMYKFQSSWYQFMYDFKFVSNQWLGKPNHTTVKL